MNKNKLVFISAFALIAAPVLAGCATNNGGTGADDKTQMTLKMGTMMPLTGALNALGSTMQNGAKLAIEQVNAATAQTGLKIDAQHEDDKTTDTAAITTTFERLASTHKATAIAGPCCSGVTSSLLKAAMESEVVLATPSATSPSLTDSPNKYFFRVVPSDAMQGKVLARLLEQDGIQRANLIVVNNAYGNGLAGVLQQEFDGTILVQAKYDENAPGDMSSQVTQVCVAPLVDAVVLIAYVDDGANALKAMQNQGCLDDVKVYGSEGVWDAKLVERAGQDAQGNFLAAGVKGTAPGVPEGYKPFYKTEYGDDPGLYSAESYDAVMYLALAAIAAKSTDGEKIADKLLMIANPPGTKFRGDQFAEAAKALMNGDDIDYVGFAHDFEFDADKREPKNGIYDIWMIDDEGKIVISESGVEA